MLSLRHCFWALYMPVGASMRRPCGRCVCVRGGGNLPPQSAYISAAASRPPHYGALVAAATLFFCQKSALPVVLGKGSTSRMLAMPVRYMIMRSKPMPKPACFAVPYLRNSRYHQ